MGFEGDAYLLAVAFAGVWLLSLVALVALLAVRPSPGRRACLWAAGAVQLAMAVRATLVGLWPLAILAAVGVACAVAVWARWRTRAPLE